MANFFDRFDVGSSPSKGGNFFDRFDAPQEAESSPLRRVTDVGVGIAKGVVGLGESMVGLADILSFGAAGEALEKIGYDPKRTRSMLSELYSTQQQAANLEVENADGFIDKAYAMIRNPSTIMGAVAEAMPGTLGIAGVGKVVATKAFDVARQAALKAGLGEAASREAGIAAVQQTLPRILTTVSAAEGAQAAGSIAEQARQEGREWADYVLPAMGAGASTAVIGRVAGTIAPKLGLGEGDLERGLATAGLAGGAGTTAGNVLARGAKGAVREGVLEEMPQSAQEQAFTNVALDKSVEKGVGSAAAAGLLTGAAMGVAHAALAGEAKEQPKARGLDEMVRDHEAKTARTVAGIVNAGSANEAIAAAMGGALYTSDVDGSLSAGLIGGAMGEAVDRAERAVREEPAYEQARVALERRKAQDFDALQAERREIDADAATAESLLQENQQAQPAKSKPMSPMQAAWGKLLLERMEARERAAQPQGATHAKVSAEAQAAPAAQVSSTIDEAAHAAATSRQNDLAEPSDKEKEAGNYQMGHPRISGLKVSIETPAGSKRRPEWPELKDHYGRIVGVPARAADKEHVDVFVKPGTADDYAGPVFIVDQYKKDGKFDEPKVVIGVGSLSEAAELYRRNYAPDWDGGRGVTPMSMEAFKAKLQDPRAFMRPQPGAQPMPSRAVSADAEMSTQSVQKRQEVNQQAPNLSGTTQDSAKTNVPESRTAPVVEKTTAPVLILGKLVEQHTKRSLEVAAARARTKAQREAAAAELARRADEAILKIPERDHQLLRNMAAESGWVEHGGKAIGARTPFEERLGIRSRSEMTAEGLGRTQWIGQPEWARGFGMSVAEMKTAVEKAIAGKPLGSKQRLAVKAMLDDIREGEADTEQAQRLSQEAGPAPDNWLTMTDEEKDAKLDEIFGPDSRQQGDAAARAPVDAPALGQGSEAPASEAGEIDGVDRAQPGRAASSAAADDAGGLGGGRASTSAARGLGASGQAVQLRDRAGPRRVEDQLERAEEREPGSDDEEVAPPTAAPSADQNVGTSAQVPTNRNTERQALELATQTEQDLKTQDLARQRADEEKRRRESAPAPADFVLAGSDRPSDQAVARGQNELFSASGAPSRSQVTTPPTESNGLVGAAQALRSAADALEKAVQPQPTTEEKKPEPPAEDDGAFARRSAPVGGAPRLSVLHNLSAENLAFADRMGGLAVPSLGVVRDGMGISGMGEITLIGRRELAEEGPVYDADVYSPTFPRPEYPQARVATAQALVNRARPFAEKFEDHVFRDQVWDNAVNNPKPHESISSLMRSNTAKAMFLAEKGVIVEPVIRAKRIEFPWIKYLDWAAYRRVLPFNDERPQEERTRATFEVKALISEAIDKYLSETREGRSLVEVHDGHKNARMVMAHGFGVRGDWLDNANAPMPYSFDWKFHAAHEALGKKEVDVVATEKRLNKALAGKEAEFKQWVDDTILKMYDAPFLRGRNGKVPYTLAHIVDAMVGRVRSAEKSMTFGEGKARAAAAKQFKGLEEMRRHAGNIAGEEEINAAREEAKKLIEAYRNDVVNYYGEKGSSEFGRVWDGLDASMRAMARWAKGGKTAENMRRALDREGFRAYDMPDVTIEDAVEAGKAFLKAPVPYFEAKPQRAVALNEFAGAVIPEKADAKTRAILEKHGIRYRTYKGEENQQRVTDELRRELAAQGEDVLFKRGGIPGAFSVDQVRDIVGPILARWGNAPEVQVIGSMAEAPPAMRLLDAAQRREGATGVPEGFIHRGKVYLVADGLASPFQVYRTLFHEALGHYGLRGTFGETLAPILDDVARSMPGRVRAKARDYGLSMDNEAQRRLAAEEVLAEMAQTMPNAGFVKRAIAAIRQFLRELGLDLELSDNDIIVNFLLPARGFVERSRVEVASDAMAEAMARNTPWYFSALERRLQDLKQGAAPASQWKATIKAFKGVSADEIEWSGLQEYLDTRQSKVTKEEILDYLSTNGVRVEETVLGESAGEKRATGERDRLVVELDALGYSVREDIDQNTDERVLTGVEQRSTGTVIPFDGNNFYTIDTDAALPERLLSIGRRLGELQYELPYRDSMDPEMTRYGRYTLPGGKNYRELLLTLPRKQGASLADEVERERTEHGESARFWELVQRQNSADERAKDFRSTHFDKANIVAHVRFNERTDAEGKRVLFLEEIQSDFGQKTKRARDDINKAVDEEFELIVKRMEDAGVLTVECD